MDHCHLPNTKINLYQIQKKRVGVIKLTLGLLFCIPIKTLYFFSSGSSLKPKIPSTKSLASFRM